MHALVEDGRDPKVRKNVLEQSQRVSDQRELMHIMWKLWNKKRKGLHLGLYRLDCSHYETVDDSPCGLLLPVACV